MTVSRLVSTIIPVYNRGRMLVEAVDSVLAQTYRPIEIIIVDDGSTDETVRIANELAEGCEEIKVLHVENGGVGRAREAGRLLAAGEFIQYLDSDDLLLPQKFELQVAALQSHTECDIAYGITRLIDETGCELECPYKGSGIRQDTLFPRLLVGRWWNTHTPLYRRSLCDRIGPWSTTRMAEDYEYDARAGALGARLVFCDQLVSSTRQHGQGRLTGGGLTVSIASDEAYLIQRLFAHAQQAGVARESAEMRHFARWAFLVARQCAAFGLIAEAKQCFEVAKQAELRRSTSLWISDILARTLGWKNLGRLAQVRDRIR